MRYIVTVFFLALFSIFATAQDADVIKSDAIMAQSIDDFVSAAQLFESAAAAYQNAGIFDTMSVYQAGVNYNRIKEYSKALDFFTKLQEKEINTIELYLSISDSYIGTKELDKAIDILESQLDKGHEDLSSIYRKLSIVTFQSKKPDKSLVYSTNSLELSPEDAFIHFIKMMSLAQSNKIDEAIKEGKAILEYDSENVRANEQVGMLMCKITDSEYNREKNRYDRMVNPTRIDYSNTRKKLAEIAKKYEEAFPYLEKALQAEPNNQRIKTVLDNSRKRISE